LPLCAARRAYAPLPPLCAPPLTRLRRVSAVRMVQICPLTGCPPFSPIIVSPLPFSRFHCFHAISPSDLIRFLRLLSIFRRRWLISLPHSAAVLYFAFICCRAPVFVRAKPRRFINPLPPLPVHQHAGRPTAFDIRFHYRLPSSPPSALRLLDIFSLFPLC